MHFVTFLYEKCHSWSVIKIRGFKKPQNLLFYDRSRDLTFHKETQPFIDNWISNRYKQTIIKHTQIRLGKVKLKIKWPGRLKNAQI
jgi:hypothetical protein